MKNKKIFGYITAAIFTLGLAIGTTSNIEAKAVTTTKDTLTTTTQKNVVTYFPNWAMYNSAHQSMVPKDIPWDKITVVNHSFFTVDKDYKIASLDNFADFDKQLEHSGDWTQTLKGCFGEYKYYKGIYPDKKILVSVGGWTRGENFHEMASTAGNRKIFTDSIVDFLKQYPFIDGIDIDWEYPGVDRKADPNDQYDRGCPGGPEDKANYTLLMKDIRDAYNANGLSSKMLTVAAAAGYNKMELVEPDKYIQYLDYMNVMTYDIHGAWENVTNHQSALYANPADPSGTSPIDLKNKYNTDYAMKAYTNIYKIPASKLNIGSPLYSRGWKGVKPGPNGDGLYQPATGAYTGSLDNRTSPGGQEPWFKLKQLENTEGWKKYYDNVANAVYLYNATTGVFLTYEDEKTLNDRCDYVLNNGYGGMLIWDSSNDDISKGCPMTTIIANKMKGSTAIKLQAATLSASDVNKGAYSLTASIPANNSATSYKIFEGSSTTPLTSGNLVSGQATSQSVSFDVKGKEAGTYTYKIVVSDATGSITSNQVLVTVPAVGVLKLQAATLSVSDVNKGAYSLTASIPANNSATSYKIFEGSSTSPLTSGKLVSGQDKSQSISFDVTGKEAGTYTYKIVVSDATGSLISNQVSVTVSAAPVGDVPEKPSLNQDNWNNLPNYKITMSMWWGVNGTSFKLYENGVLVSTKTLTANGSNAQTDFVEFTGKAKGTYVYQAELINAAGSTLSDKLTYTVN